ncbi:hypothetical protein SK128_009670 [Halocaridina rubra]|uniref:Uncharacterized protein n=1 Tax=Halocaridina rubra TaxID=373956 RepID=A0AAN9A0C2_HALRR
MMADVEQGKKRLFFVSETAEYTTGFSLSEDVKICESIKLYAKQYLQDMTTPFVIRGEVKYIPSNSNQVLLDPNVNLLKRETLEILIHCENNTIGLCKSNLIIRHEM